MYADDRIYNCCECLESGLQFVSLKERICISHENEIQRNNLLNKM